MGKKDNLAVIPDQKTIDAEAADWLLRLEEDDLSPAEKAAFQTWRGASVRHREAFDRLSAVWGDFAEAGVLADHAMSDESAALLERDAGSARLGVFARRSVLTGIAASVAGLAGVGIAPQLAERGVPPRRGSFSTQIGEQRQIKLPDGSTINLNTNSSIAYVFSEYIRHLQLSRGEAYFDVASDKARPFVVETAKGKITAVGTAFTVRINKSKIDVLVSEGRVAIHAGQEARANVTTHGENVQPIQSGMEVAAGQEAVFEDNVERVNEVGADVLARKLSWRQGVLAFSAEPLSMVIEDISRYTDINIAVEDETLRDLPVSGYFKIGEVNEMFEALELMANLQAVWVNDKKVQLVRMDRG